MSIYTSYHPIDSSFAAELTTYLRNCGFNPKPFPVVCGEQIGITFSKNDVVIIILRPDYVKSSVYTQLSENIPNINLLPILRVPIEIEDWGENITLNPVADFASLNSEQILFNKELLSELLIPYINVSNLKKPSAKEIYINNLQLILQQAYFPLDTLERLNYKCDPPSEIPLNFFLSNTKFKTYSFDEAFLSEGHNQERTEYLENIAKYRESFTVNCDYLDSRLVASFMVDKLLRQFITSNAKAPLPVMLNVQHWDMKKTWDDWLSEQLNFNSKLLENTLISDLVFYVYGFEYSSLKVSQFRKNVSALWQGVSPPPRVVIVYPYFEDTSVNNRSLIIGPVQYNLTVLKQVCSRYPDRPFAQFLLRCVENDENTPELKYFLENPTFAAILLSVRFEEGLDFSKQRLDDFFRHFIDNLWELGDDTNNAKLQVFDALSKLATILTDQQKSFITHNEALKFFQSEILLTKCIESGLFVFTDNNIRFSLSIIQNYFAAIALAQYGIPSQLPRLTLTTLCDRIPQRWDHSVIIFSHRTALSDGILETVADSDPILALHCLASGAYFSELSYSYVIDKNLNALVSVGDFRLSFAKLLYKVDPVSAQAIFVEVMRNARWPNRIHAYSIFQELDISSMPGLVESLTNINNLTRSRVSHALKRIGSNALPTLLRLLNSDNVTTRLNTIWAVCELKDRACVPALVKALWDHNHVVVTQAVDTLGVLHDVQSVTYLVRCLHQRHMGIRKAVVNALVKIQSHQSDSFIEIVRQMDAPLRRLLVVYLSTSQTNTLLNFLLAFSYDEDVDVKIAAIQGLATIAEPHVISRLEECLEDMSRSRLYKSTVGEIVSKILSNISTHVDGKQTDKINTDSNKALSSSQIVKSRLLSVKEQRLDSQPINESESIYSRLAAENNDVNISKTNDLLSPEDAYVSDILTQLRSGTWNTSSNAAKTLREHVKTLRGNTTLRVMNQILETLNDDNWVIRWTGVETLGWVGNVHVVPHLIQRLTDPNWKVKIAAIRALVEINDRNAIIGVSKLISDNNPLVREAAAEALGYLDGSEGISALETASLDSEEFVRLSAVESLGKLHDNVAIHTLLSALKDSSEHVRWAAANGLSGIADADLVSALIPSLSDSAGPYWEQKRICDVIVDILKQINTEEAKIALLEWQSSQA